MATETIQIEVKSEVAAAYRSASPQVREHIVQLLERSVSDVFGELGDADPFLEEADAFRQSRFNGVVAEIDVYAAIREGRR
ncbi:MAG: hypothetical protein AAGJ10_19670 [Bacteroidota bacterium]